MWNWFLKNGDKVLAWATGQVAAAQLLTVKYPSPLLSPSTFAWTMFALGGLTALHNTFLPEPKETPKEIAK